ncbi:MAG: hypothetical protein K8I30_21710, partial [Anaerolineae bacterium]|nr:hypothetical protein [Anaerolineae bacterium]
MNRRLLGFGIACFLLGACSGQTAAPYPQAVYTPTPTTEITPVPLYLTPIASPEPLPILSPLTNSQSSKPLALHDNLLVVTNPDSGSVTLIDTTTLAKVDEIFVDGSPRSAAIAPDGQTALVTVWDQNALGVIRLRDHRLTATYPVGHMPYGVVTDGRRIYVSLQADDLIAVIDPASGDVIHRVDVPDAPTGLALSGNWLLVTHLYSGLVTVINVERTPFAVGSVNVEADGVQARSIVIAPDGGRAYIPQTRTGLALVSLQYMQDWFPVVGILDIAQGTGDRDRRLTVSEYDRPVNMPSDVALSADGRALYVALAGSDAVLVVDVSSGQHRAYVEVGTNPTGIAVSGSQVFVLNALDGSVSVINAASYAVEEVIPVTDIPLAPEILRGKILFNRAVAPAMSDGAISCATCHIDGGADTRSWINFRSGPRNTPALGGAALLPPYNWAGDMVELQDTIEDHIRYVMLGDGLIEGLFDPTTPTVDAGRSDDLDALTAYVASLKAPVSPYRMANESLNPAAQRGMRLFMSGSPDCSCHAPPLYTDQKPHNLTGAGFSLEEFEAFDTPSLRGLWATAPYM